MIELFGTVIGLLAYGAACIWMGTIVERVKVERRKRTALGQHDATESMFMRSPETARH